MSPEPFRLWVWILCGTFPDHKRYCGLKWWIRCFCSRHGVYMWTNSINTTCSKFIQKWIILNCFSLELWTFFILQKTQLPSGAMIWVTGIWPRDNGFEPCGGWFKKNCVIPLLFNVVLIFLPLGLEISMSFSFCVHSHLNFFSFWVNFHLYFWTSSFFLNLCWFTLPALAAASGAWPRIAACSYISTYSLTCNQEY